jgi:hypothetical protein
MKSHLFLFALALVGLNMYAVAQGNLLITPKRVVFDGNKQREELSLVNIGKDTATYSVSFVHKNMQEDGSFVNIEKPDPGQMFSEPYLRIFPRQITLAPGEPQSVMLQCRRKADMVAGEYRSHLWFRSEKDYRPLGTKELSKDSSQVSVQLIPIFGISIPIIIRSGAVNVSTSLSDFKLETQKDTIQILQFIIHREGNCSSYGNLVIDYVPEQGKSFQIGNVKSLGVYSNLSQRKVSVRLNHVPGLTLKNGRLRVRYTSPDELKYTIYAEKEISSDELQRMNYAITSAK